MVIRGCEIFLLPTQYCPLVVPWPLHSISQINPQGGTEKEMETLHQQMATESGSSCEYWSQVEPFEVKSLFPCFSLSGKRCPTITVSHPRGLSLLSQVARWGKRKRRPSTSSRKGQFLSPGCHWEQLSCRDGKGRRKSQFPDRESNGNMVLKTLKSWCTRQMPKIRVMSKAELFSVLLEVTT